MPNAFTITTYLLPVCTGWQGLSGTTHTALAGLLLKKATFSKSEAVYERMGIFGLDRAQASILYGVRFDEPHYIDKALHPTSAKVTFLV